MILKKEVVELLKSGDFTIAYHDMGSCDLYKGRFKNYDSLGKPFIQFDCESYGYLPKEVKLLVEALGGKSISI